MKASVAPERQGEIELVLREIDGDDARGATGDRSEQGGEPDTAEPDHGHRLSGLDPGRVHRGADPRQHGAAEERGDLMRDIGFDLHQRAA